MIKIVVSNMSCGHCYLKIKAELEASNFEVVKIDMDEKSVLLNTSVSQLKRINAILENIHYVLDDQSPILSLEERHVWNDKLENDDTYNEFSDYLLQRGIDILGFDDEEIAVIVFCTELEYTQILDYLVEL